MKLIYMHEAKLRYIHVWWRAMSILITKIIEKDCLFNAKISSDLCDINLDAIWIQCIAHVILILDGQFTTLPPLNKAVLESLVSYTSIQVKFIFNVCLLYVNLTLAPLLM